MNQAESTLDAKLREYISEIPLYQSGQPAVKEGVTGAGLLARLPAVTKQDIKKDFPRNFLRKGQSLDDLVARRIVEVEHTAGTTDNRADLLLEYGWWLRQEQWALTLNPLIANVLAETPHARRVTISSPACNGEITYDGTPSAKRRSLGNTRFLSLSRFPFLLAEDDLDRMIAETREWDPVFLDTDPVYAVVFALHCERRQVTFPKLKFIFTSYEFTSVLHQRILERAFRVPVFNLYGSTETGHLLMENGAGQMVPSERMAYLDVQNQDERGVGELVISTLTNDYMPLLNYRIGDLVERRAVPGEHGASRVTYLLHGRAPDAIKSPTGRRITTRDVDQCFVGCHGIVHYRLHEHAPGRFTLRYIPEGGGPSKDALGAVTRGLQELLGPQTPLEAKPIEFLLPEPSGKFVFCYPYLP